MAGFIGDACGRAQTRISICRSGPRNIPVFPGYRLRNAHLCTVDLARRLVPHVESHGLDSLVAYFGFGVSRRHRAADDALATARVFLRLLNDLSENGILTLAEARSFQAKLAAGELQLTFHA